MCRGEAETRWPDLGLAAWCSKEVKGEAAGYQAANSSSTLNVTITAFGRRMAPAWTPGAELGLDSLAR
jgi:hypothetical protein